MNKIRSKFGKMTCGGRKRGLTFAVYEVSARQAAKE